MYTGGGFAGWGWGGGGMGMATTCDVAGTRLARWWWTSSTK